MSDKIWDDACAEVSRPCRTIDGFRECPEYVTLHADWEKLRRINAEYSSALASIAAWRRVNISGEYEHGLRDIVRSITDCAAAALAGTDTILRWAEQVAELAALTK